MKIFKWHVLSDEEFEELKRGWFTRMRVIECHRWFSGWKDLDIIWDYLLTPTYFGSISSVRNKYAKSRGTDEYGNATRATESEVVGR